VARIVLEGVTKCFADGAAAVRDVSLEVEDGEFFVLVGPSGCGKSTLLHLIVGLEEPSEGRISADGRALDGVDPKDRNMALVFQSYALYPHLSVRENLAFPLRLARKPRAEIDRRVAETAALLELTPLLERRPAALSGGQRQRVAMGRAIVREPAAFLMDEPLSNLDARLRAQMRGEIARLQRRLGVTTIYVTHDQTEAMTLADRLAVLRRGAVQQVGTPRELYGSPANLFVASFLGAPSMNLVAGELEGERLHLPMADLARPRQGGLPDRGPVVAGVRPEDLREAHAAAPGDVVFEARAELIEWLGSDAYVRVDVAGGGDLAALSELDLPGLRPDRCEWIARLGAGSEVREGDAVRLAFEPAALHLFDGTTGARLGTAS
jgi:multiple sugar transport system ATP-binding protein